mgnify:CR=1 FL=1
MTDEEIKTVRKLIPHNFVIFSIKSIQPQIDVQLKSTEWAIITQVDGVRTVQRITDNLGLKEEESLPLFYGLYKKQLIKIKEIQSPDKIFASEEFFSELESTLIKIIGPVANYLINDVIWELNEKRDRFLKDKIPLLIESISQEINDEQKSVQFQQEMLKKIKNI